jgi:hypothetical protein
MSSEAVIIRKRELLRLLGWVNDEVKTRSDLLDPWVETGGNADNPYRDAIGGAIGAPVVSNR